MYQKEFQEKLTEIEKLNCEFEELKREGVNTKEIVKKLEVLQKEYEGGCTKLRKVAERLKTKSKELSKATEKIDRRDAQLAKSKIAHKEHIKELKKKENEINSVKKENKKLKEELTSEKE